MARMLGTFAQSRCPSCRRAAGVDCGDSSRTKKAQRAREKREWRREARAALAS
jgi:hypothetical protein